MGTRTHIAARRAPDGSARRGRAALGYAADTSGAILKTVDGGGSATTVLLLGTGIRRSSNSETFRRVSGRAGRARLLDGDRAARPRGSTRR